MSKTIEEVREINKQWCLLLIEKRDNARRKLNKSKIGSEDYEFLRGEWAALLKLVNSEFAPDLIVECESS